MEGPFSEKIRRVVSRLSGFVSLEPSELQQLSELGGRTCRFERGDVITSDVEHDTYLLVDGWAASAVMLADGSRQLISVNLPGDVLGLPGLAVQNPIDTVVALTTVEVTSISKERLGDMFRSNPRIAAIMFLISQEERSLLMEKLALTGQTAAITRLAALLMRICERSAQSEDTDGESEMPGKEFFLPLTQRELGELIGVSAVHTNALVKQLRNEGVLSIKNRSMTIHDAERLREIAGIVPWRRSEPKWLPSR